MARYKAMAARVALGHADVPAVVTDAREAIPAVYGFLESMLRPDGSFLYQADLDPSAGVRVQYNVLRHAGSVYAMAEAVRHGVGSAEAVARAARFFRLAFVRPAEGGRTAVWSLPRLNGDRRPYDAVKLGACGLALLALAGRAPAADLRGVASFVLHMQRDDGGFHSKYVPSRGGMQTDWVSLYYPGEAALGLMALYEAAPSPDAAWLRGAKRALLYLARLREGQAEVEPDHWALIATGRLLLLSRERADVSAAIESEERRAIVAHAEQVARHMLREQAAAARAGAPAGCFERSGRATPSATRLEGLLALRGAAEAGGIDASLADRLDEAAHAGMRFLLGAWVRDGPDRGAVPRSPLRGSDLRIDYNQHALSAMLQYVDLYGKAG